MDIVYICNANTVSIISSRDKFVNDKSNFRTYSMYLLMGIKIVLHTSISKCKNHTNSTAPDGDVMLTFAAFVHCGCMIRFCEANLIRMLTLNWRKQPQIRIMWKKMVSDLCHPLAKALSNSLPNGPFRPFIWTDICEILRKCSTS